MHNNSNGERLIFCVVPFLETPIDKDYRVGPYQIWPNTPENWKRYMGNFDGPKLTEQYCDKDQNPRKERITIISHIDRNKLVTREEFRGVVVCLSTAEWISGGIEAADPWIFEMWIFSLPQSESEEERIYHRASKFSFQMNSAGYDRVYPTPYMARPLKFHLEEQEHSEIQPGQGHSQLQLLLDFVTKQLTENRSKSLIGVMYRFHRIRFEAPYYTSIGDDLDAMWSGFELMFLPKSNTSIDETIEEPKGSSFLGNCVRRLLNTRLLQQLRKPEKRTRPNKADRLVIEIIKEFHAELETGLIDREFFEPGVKCWAQKLYSKRNEQSHGGDSLPVLDEVLTPYRQTIFEIGIVLAREILRFRVLNRNFGNSEQSKMAEALFRAKNHSINLLFSECPITDEILNFVNGVKRADQWYSFVDADLLRFSELLWKFSHIERIGNLYHENKSVINAAYKMSKVLSAFSRKSDLRSVKLDGVALKNIALKITEIINEQEGERIKIKQQEQDSHLTRPNKKDVKINEEERELRRQRKFMSKLSAYCEQNYFHREYNYDTMIDIKQKQIVGQIAVWTWVASMIRLSKLYNGY